MMKYRKYFKLWCELREIIISKCLYTNYKNNPYQDLLILMSELERKTNKKEQ